MKFSNMLSIIVIGMCTTFPGYAIDNPDAPDYVAEFEQRAQPFATVIHQQAKTTQETLKAYADYEKFLDKELNDVYKKLIGKLGAEQQTKLKKSQRDWIKYRDTEFDFIASNWTTKNFGSSSVLSRGDYRTSILRNRVEQLLYYWKNY